MSKILSSTHISTNRTQIDAAAISVTACSLVVISHTGSMDMMYPDMRAIIVFLFTFLSPMPFFLFPAFSSP